MAGVVASRVAGGFVVSVPFEVAEEFVDALVVLGERLIGEVPSVLREVESALWAGQDAAVRLVPDVPLVEDVEVVGEMGRAAGARLLEASVAVGEGRAVVRDGAVTERAEAFLGYVAGQEGRRREALGVWLDRYAEEFGEARARWERDWLWGLEDEFLQAQGVA